jgi:hypothetical protein
MYMQANGLLAKFYAYYRAHHRGAGADISAIEHVFGKKLARIEKEFVAWAKTLRFRP